ncbi:MAG: MFS transporter [Clostridia bacterium]|nr:MFS transporter [Clostridia bacterium]
MKDGVVGAGATGAGPERRRDHSWRLRWNFKVSTLDGMFASVAMGMVNPFLAVFALSLGATNGVVGMITAVPALVNTIMYLPAAGMVERRRSKLRTSVTGALFTRVFYLLMAFVPFLPWAKYRATILVAAIGLQTIPAVVTAVAWTALMGETFPAEERARVFSMRSMFCSLVALLSSLLAGILLDRVPYPANYAALFVVSFLTSMVSLHYLSLMKETPMSEAASVRLPLSARLRRPFVDKEHGRKFSVFTASALLLHLGINIAVPVYTIYHVRVLHLSNSIIGTLSLAGGLTAVLAYPMWGVVARRAGDAAVYTLSILAYALFPVMYGLSRSPGYLIALQAAVGFFNAGFAFTLFNLTLAYVNPTESANGIAVFNMLINATGIIAPFIATSVVSRWGIMPSFILSTLVRILGCVIFIKAVGVDETFGKLHRMVSPSALRRRRLNRKAKGVL